MSLRHTLLAASLLLVASPAFAQASRVQNALDYLTRESTDLGLSQNNEAEWSVTNAYESRRSGTMHVYLRQTVGGIEVVGSEMTVSVGRDGRVFHSAGEMAAGLDQQIVEQRRSLDAMSAVLRAASYAGIRAMPSLRLQESGSDASLATSFSVNGLEDNPVRAKLVYKLDANDVYRLSWEVEIALASQSQYWLVFVDASTGEEVDKFNLTVEESFGDVVGNTLLSEASSSFMPFEAEEHALAALAPAAIVGSYRVFQLPVESPKHSVPALPADGRTTHANPDNATASPFGWHDTNGIPGAEFTDSRGNNVDALKGATRSSGGASLIFNDPANFANSPVTFVAAAITNTFYHSNVFHDIAYQYGFDEPAGNFQENNYGNGGVGSDRVTANVQAAGNCNANFGTPSDGGNPTMNMYLCTTPNPDADTDFDTVVIQHEIAHGISNRLTGGPANVNCLNNAEQMGEGWSDFFGISTTMEVGDARGDTRGVATYSLTGGSPTSGGIRLAPYDTDFAANNYTYQRTRTLSGPHAIGFVWATALWEVMWDLVDAHGFSTDLYNAGGTAGNQIMLNLVMEGMKLQPCSPGFVTGRDAILAADVSLYGGAHTDELWAAFARRGLGLSASQGSSTTNSDNTEAFDVPPPSGDPITLTVTTQSNGAGTKGKAILDWIPFDGGTDKVEVFRDGSLVRNTADDGHFVDRLNPPPASANYQVCDRETGECSNTVSVTFLSGAVADNSATSSALASESGLTELRGAYPNPFNPTSTIRFALAERGPIELSVFNTLGQRVAVLASGVEEAGSHEVQFDASSLPSGVYIYTLNAEGQLLTGRLMLVK